MMMIMMVGIIITRLILTMTNKVMMREVIRFLKITASDRSYFEESNICLTDTGFFSHLGILGICFKRDCRKVKRESLPPSLMSLKLLGMSVGNSVDCHGPG